MGLGLAIELRLILRGLVRLVRLGVLGRAFSSRGSCVSQQCCDLLFSKSNQGQLMGIELRNLGPLKTA